jgi:hypothetical protein
VELGTDYANFKKFCVTPGSLFYDKHKKEALAYSDFASVSTILGYLKFYLRPGFLFKQLAKIRSWSDFRFLIRIGLDEFLFQLYYAVNKNKLSSLFN